MAELTPGQILNKILDAINGALKVELSGGSTIPVATGQNPAPVSTVSNVTVPPGTIYKSPSVSTTGLTATVAKAAVKLQTANGATANVTMYTIVADGSQFINFNGPPINDTTHTGAFALVDTTGAQLAGGLNTFLQLTNHDSNNAITIVYGGVYLH